MLLVLTWPGAQADDGPQNPVPQPEMPIPPEEALRQAQGAADEAQGQAQDQAQQTQGQAEEQAGAAHQQVADAKNAALGQLQASLTGAQGVLADVVSYAGQTVLALRQFATNVLSHVLAPNPDAPKPFQPDSTGAGSVDVQSSSTATAPLLVQAGLALAVAAASAGGALLYYVVLQRMVLFGLIPLLSRIAHSEIYTNDARRTIGEMIASEPGLCLNDLVIRTGYSRNAVSYHLFVLEKEDELVSIKDGKYRRYFTRNGKYVNGAKNVVSALRNPTTRKMAQYVSDHPGTIQREICVVLGTTASAACWHAQRLEDLLVIRKQRVANTVQYYPGEAMSKYDLSEFGLKPGAPGPELPAPVASPAPRSGVAARALPTF